MSILKLMARLMWRLRNGKPHPDYDEFLKVKEMRVDQMGMSAALEGSAVPMLIESFGAILDATPEAKNYLSVDVCHPKYGYLEVIIQKSSGKTPATINNELKADIVKLKARIAELEATP